MKHHLPAGSAVEGPYGLVITPESAGWTHSALRVLDLPDGGEHTFATGEFETIVLPLAGSCVVECDGSRFELEGRDDVFSRVSDFAYVPRDAQVTVRGSRPVCAGTPAARRAWSPATGPPRRCRWSCAALDRRVGRSTTSARPRVPVRREADRVRGTHAGRLLVVLPAAQARRGPARRVGAGGDLLLRGRPGRHGLPARLRLAGTSHRRPRGGPQRRCRPHPARLARPVDGAAGPRSLLPERDGRPVPGTGLEHLRRPRPRVDPRHLDGPGGRFPAAPDVR